MSHTGTGQLLGRKTDDHVRIFERGRIRTDLGQHPDIPEQGLTKAGDDDGIGVKESSCLIEPALVEQSPCDGCGTRRIANDAHRDGDRHRSLDLEQVPPKIVQKRALEVLAHAQELGTFLTNRK
ncbi:MAG: hypothetical protein QM784_13230 [Polyangiaceae bacterium]